MSQEEIIEIIERNPDALYQKPLSEKATTYLEDYLGRGNKKVGRVKLNDIIIKKGFVSISRFKVNRNENGELENARVNWLENREVSPDDIIKLIGNNPTLFSSGDLFEEKITYLKKYLGKGDMEVGEVKLNNIIKMEVFMVLSYSK